LACYWVYCKDMPADAEPRLTPKYEAHINPVKRDPPQPKPVCLVHGIQLPKQESATTASDLPKTPDNAVVRGPGLARFRSEYGLA
jgi:hypothetical protein